MTIGQRRKMSDTRSSISKTISIHHNNLAGVPAEIHIEITVGLYDDGTPGEVFLKAEPMGSAISGLLDALSICMSIGIQYGVPLEAFTSKLTNMKFEPSGMTTDINLKLAHSIVDVVARWLTFKFPPKEEK